jgi:hypothetical protein
MHIIPDKFATAQCNFFDWVFFPVEFLVAFAYILLNFP